jgi:hypothetical protein
VQIGYWLRKLTVRDHLEDAGVDGKIILNCNEMGWEVVDWINLATGYGQGQVVWTGLTWPRATDRDRWCGLD